MSSDRFVTIPTRLNRPTLYPLVEQALQVAQVVVVHTEPGHNPIPGTIVVEDYRSSIQQWWNAGLDRCAGPTIVLNDDVQASAAALQQLFDVLDNADLVYLAGHRIGHSTPLTGWCYGLRPDKIRPDEAFEWWYGDDDLILRAAKMGLRIEAVNVPEIQHVRGEAAFEKPEHREMAQRDLARFNARYR